MLAWAVSPDVTKLFGRGGGFTWSGDIAARLPEEVYPRSVLPLRALDSDIVRQHPGPLDAPVCGPHKSDGNPTLDVSARP